MAIQRIYFYADADADADLFAWLAGQANRSEAIRMAIRAAAGQDTAGASLDEALLRRVLREEISHLAALAAAPAPASAGEDDELRDALDGLASAWQFEEEQS